MDGYVKLPRELIEELCEEGPVVVAVFLTCLRKANYKAVGDVPRGSFIASLEWLADHTKSSIQEVRTSLKKLSTLSRINTITNTKATRRSTQISVLEYEAICNSATQSPTQNQHKEQHGVNKAHLSPVREVVDVGGEVSPVVKKHPLPKKASAAGADSKGRSGRVKSADSIEGFENLVHHIRSSYKAKTSHEIPILYGDHNQLVMMSRNYETPVLAAAWDRFFRQNDDFIRNNGHSIRMFYSRLSGILEDSAVKTDAEKLRQSWWGKTDTAAIVKQFGVSAKSMFDQALASPVEQAARKKLQELNERRAAKRQAAAAQPVVPPPPAKPSPKHAPKPEPAPEDLMTDEDLAQAHRKRTARIPCRAKDCDWCGRAAKVEAPA
jgi:hypothetical protein